MVAGLRLNRRMPLDYISAQFDSYVEKVFDDVEREN